MSEHEHDSATIVSAQRGVLIAFSITIFMCAAEFIGGLASNSLVLVGDAGHMLTDTLALGMTLYVLKVV